MSAHYSTPYDLAVPSVDEMFAMVAKPSRFNAQIECTPIALLISGQRPVVCPFCSTFALPAADARLAPRFAAHYIQHMLPFLQMTRLQHGGPTDAALHQKLQISVDLFVHRLIVAFHPDAAVVEATKRIVTFSVQDVAPRVALTRAQFDQIVGAVHDAYFAWSVAELSQLPTGCDKDGRLIPAACKHEVATAAAAAMAEAAVAFRQRSASLAIGAGFGRTMRPTMPQKLTIEPRRPTAINPGALSSNNGEVSPPPFRRRSKTLVHGSGRLAVCYETVTPMQAYIQKQKQQQQQLEQQQPGPAVEGPAPFRQRSMTASSHGSGHLSSGYTSLCPSPQLSECYE